MTKAFSYKLALLGCVSSCLMNVAYANSDDLVHLELIGPGPYEPELRDITCEGKPVVYNYKLTNYDDDPARVNEISIKTRLFDDFKRHPGLIVVLPPKTTDDCGYGQHHTTDGHDFFPRFNFDLDEKGGTCNVNIQVNPQVISCGHHDNTLPTTGLIDRDLYVKLGTYQRHVISKFDHIGVTLIGSLDSFSLVGTRICTSDSETQCDPDGLFTQASLITTPEDIALLDEDFYLSPDITSAGDIYSDDDAAAIAAGNDLKTVYETLIALGEHEVAAQSCNLLSTNLNYHDNRPVTIQGGVHCFVGDTPVSVSGPTTFDSKGSQIILIAHGDHSSDGMAITVTDKGHFKFAPGTDIDDVTWVSSGDVEIESISENPAAGTYNFAGNLIMNGDFEMDAPGLCNGGWDPKPCVPAIAGGIYSLHDHDHLGDDEVKGGGITLGTGTVFASTTE